MKKLVGITCGHIFKDGSAHRNAVNTTYSRAIASAGALAVLLPVGDPADAAAYLDRVDGLLLPGGIDVEPKLFGQENHPNLGETDEAQDLFEIAMAQEAWKRRMPMMAICRGIQLLNVALGGTLIQDISSQVPGAIKHEQGVPRDRASHKVVLAEGGRLRDIAGSNEAIVNSHHHQAVENIGSNLQVVARASDGLIEALEDPRPDRFTVAVQWHPELGWKDDRFSEKLFQTFVAEASSFKLRCEQDTSPVTA